MARGNRTCDSCGRSFITPRKLRDHQNRKFPCKPHSVPVEQPAPPVIQPSVDDLADWLAGPSHQRENPSTNNPQRQTPQTESEWFESMERRGL